MSAAVDAHRDQWARHGRRITAAWVHRWGDGCRICGTHHNLHTHHLHYLWEVGHETDAQLVRLCKRHHLLVHAIHRRHHPTDRHPYSRLLLERTTRTVIRRRRRWWRTVRRRTIPPCPWETGDTR